MRTYFFITFFTVLSSCLYGQDSTKFFGIYSEVELELNNGSRWILPEEMKNALNDQFEYFEKISLKTNVKSKKFGKKLMSKAEEIYEVCDIEGPGHNMFHHWLVPYWGLLEEFRDSYFKEDQEEYYFKIRNAKSVLDLYFQ